MHVAVRFRRVVPYFAMLIMSIGCNAQHAPVEILPGVTSRAESAHLKRSLSVDESRWRITEDTKTPAGDKRPPYHYMVVSVRDFSACGVSSDADLAFFNDRLLNVTCYPTNFDSFANALAKLSIVNIAKGETMTRAGASVHVGADSAGRRFATIEDVQLRHEHDTWIRKYS